MTSTTTFDPRPGALRPGDIVSMKPRPKRPAWWRLLLILPWIRWRRAIEEWRRLDCYHVLRVTGWHTITLDRAPPKGATVTLGNPFEIRPANPAPELPSLRFRRPGPPRMTNRPGRPTRWR